MKQLIAVLSVLALAIVGFSVFAQGGGAQQPAQHKMPRMEIIVESRYGFDETVEAIKKAAEAEKYPVQGVHEISKILASKGFPREPLSVVEVCNAKMASASLNNDLRTSLMMPCPVTVYQKGDRVYVMTFDTRAMSMMYDGATMPQVGAEVNASLRNILFSVAKR